MADRATGEVLVDVEHVSKRFCRDLRMSLLHGAKDIAGELLGRGVPDRRQLRQGEFWALDDVSFQLRRGECLGLIGPNGAGKSTLLKLISGLIKPDAGRLKVRGRVGALIELGAGFHPLLTGRENIRVNASILGLSQRQLADRQDQIIDFADIGDAIDASVQSYSSGMRARLGFAIAAHLDPDVLLIDEVLAVGDVGFRGKCYNRLASLQHSAGFILVSHNMEPIVRTCNVGLVLANGRSAFFGTSKKAAEAYFDQFAIPEAAVYSKDVQITSVALTPDPPIIESHLGDASSLILNLCLHFTQPTLRPELVICVVASGGEYVTHSAFDFHDNVLAENCVETVRMTVRFPDLRLASGNYAFSIAVRDGSKRRFMAWLPRVAPFRVRSPYVVPAHYIPVTTFEVDRLVASHSLNGDCATSSVRTATHREASSIPSSDAKGHH